MIELCCEYLPVRCIWLYILIKSRTRFRVHPHFIVAWRNSFEQEVLWHSGNYRVLIHSETRKWHDKNIQLHACVVIIYVYVLCHIYFAIKCVHLSCHIHVAIICVCLLCHIHVLQQIFKIFSQVYKLRCYSCKSHSGRIMTD